MNSNILVQNYLNDTSVSPQARKSVMTTLNNGKGTPDEAANIIRSLYGNKYNPTPNQAGASAATSLFKGMSNPVEGLEQGIGAAAPTFGKAMSSYGDAFNSNNSKLFNSSLVVKMPRIEPKDALNTLFNNAADIPLGALDFAQGMAGAAGDIGNAVFNGEMPTDENANKISQGFNRAASGVVKTLAAPTIATATIAPTFVEDVYGSKGTADVMRGAESAVATVGNLPNAAIGNLTKFLAGKLRPDLSEADIEANIVKPLQTAWQLAPIVNKTWRDSNQAHKDALMARSQAEASAAQAGKMTPTKADLLRAGVSEADANMISNATPEQTEYLKQALEQSKKYVNDQINNPNPFKWEADKLDDSLDKLDDVKKSLGQKVGDAKLYFKDSTITVPRADFDRTIIDALDDADVNAVKIKNGIKVLDLEHSDLRGDAEAIKVIKSLVNPDKDLLGDLKNSDLTLRDTLSAVKALNKALGTYTANGKLIQGESDVALQMVANKINQDLLYPQSAQYQEAASNYAKFMDDYKAIKSVMVGMKGGDEYTKGEAFLRSIINNTNQTNQVVIPAWQRLGERFGVETPEGLNWKPYYLKFAQNTYGSYKPGSLEGILSALPGVGRKANVVQAVADYVNPTEKVRNSINKLESIVSDVPVGDFSLSSSAAVSLKAGLAELGKLLNPTTAQEVKSMSDKAQKNPLQSLIPSAHAAEPDQTNLEDIYYTDEDGIVRPKNEPAQPENSLTPQETIIGEILKAGLTPIVEGGKMIIDFGDKADMATQNLEGKIKDLSARFAKNFVKPVVEKLTKK